MIKIQTENIKWRPRNTSMDVLSGCDFVASKGQTVGLLGPNGSGKTSFLRCLYRSYQPDSGTVSIDGRNIDDYSRLEIAQKVAVVLQESPSDIFLNVIEVLNLSRLPYQTLISSSSKKFSQEEKNLLERLELTPLIKRRMDTLSGGEKQRVMVARALLQNPEILILDEPTNHLDISHQLSVLRLLQQLDITVICSLHDLTLAAQYCDEVAVMDKGNIIVQGEPKDVLDQALIKNIFNVESISDYHPVTGQLRLNCY
ncbi:MAG: ABC transporter ATP-binding protein [Flavobacteriales bacterium]|nr:ABC transporter ATP-binding protein [Flavobacteriales bacterium]